MLSGFSAVFAGAEFKQVRSPVSEVRWLSCHHLRRGYLL
jgi:hypothetical protein